MNENEKRLRGWCMNAPAMSATLDEVLRDVRSSARAEALEEAASRLYEFGVPADVLPDVSKCVRRLAHARPAYIPVERVREVLVAARASLRESGLSTAIITDMSGALGVPLDGAEEMCACGEPRSHHDDHGRIVKFNGGNTLTLCAGFRVTP